MSQKSEYEYMKEIESLLSGVLKDLSKLTDENFETQFKSAKEKMLVANRQKVDLFAKYEASQTKTKISEMAKLISEKFDDIVQEWQKKVNNAQNDLEQIQNQKKILIYNR
jgi:predicted phage tail protein